MAHGPWASDGAPVLVSIVTSNAQTGHPIRQASTEKK